VTAVPALIRTGAHAYGDDASEQSTQVCPSPDAGQGYTEGTQTGRQTGRQAGRQAGRQRETGCHHGGNSVVAHGGSVSPIISGRQGSRAALPGRVPGET